MPPHSSHILQPLDVVCFSPLKRKYSQRIRDLARRRVFHINKEGFLPAFKDAFFDVFTEANCQKAFEALGVVPLNPQVVLDRLEVRLRTPPAPLPQETPWQSKTPSNTHRVWILVEACTRYLYSIACSCAGWRLPAYKR